MNSISAKACVVDDIRDYLCRVQCNVPFAGLCRQTKYLADDVHAALEYLKRRNEVIAERGRGWRYLGILELQFRRQA